MIIYSTGYGGTHHDSDTGVIGAPRLGKFEAFRQFVQNNRLVVCDIRKSPRSPAPCWTRHNMEAALGAAYCWIPNLGNDNYANGGPISIHNLDKGVWDLVSVASRTAKIALLLCGCEDAEYCHRTVVAEDLRRRGHLVSEVTWWDAPMHWDAFWASDNARMLKFDIGSQIETGDMTVGDLVRIADRYAVHVRTLIFQLEAEGAIAPGGWDRLAGRLSKVRAAVQERAGAFCNHAGPELPLGKGGPS